MVPRKCDAAFRRSVAWSRKMYEDRTPGALNTGLDVMIEHDDHIVEMIRTPQTLRADRIGVANSAIVVSIADGIAPTIIGPEGPRRERRARALHPISAIEDAHQMPPSTWRCAIALPFGERPATASQGTRHWQPPDPQHTAWHSAGTRKNPQRRGNRAISTRDCHLCLDSCFKWATSDMLRSRNWPLGSVAS